MSSPYEKQPTKTNNSNNNKNNKKNNLSHAKEQDLVTPGYSKLVDHINSFLPHDIRVYGAQRTARSFHPRFCGLWREYEYIVPLNILVRDKQNENTKHLSTEELEKLEIEHFNAILKKFVGFKVFHNFTSSSILKSKKGEEKAYAKRREWVFVKPEDQQKKDIDENEEDEEAAQQTSRRRAAENEDDNEDEDEMEGNDDDLLAQEEETQALLRALPKHSAEYLNAKLKLEEEQRAAELSQMRLQQEAEASSSATTQANSNSIGETTKGVTAAKAATTTTTPFLQDEKEAIVIMENGVEKLNETLTSRDIFERTVCELVCENPFYVITDPTKGTKVKVALIRIKGYSFMKHQIRKMIGTAIAVHLGLLPYESLEIAIESNVRFNTPLAPALPLILNDVLFAQHRATGQHQFDLSNDPSIEQKKADFKFNVLYPHIIELLKDGEDFQYYYDNVKKFHQDVDYKLLKAESDKFIEWKKKYRIEKLKQQRLHEQQKQQRKLEQQRQQQEQQGTNNYGNTTNVPQQKQAQQQQQVQQQTNMKHSKSDHEFSLKEYHTLASAIQRQFNYGSGEGESIKHVMVAMQRFVKAGYIKPKQPLQFYLDYIELNYEGNLHLLAAVGEEFEKEKHHKQ